MNPPASSDHIRIITHRTGTSRSDVTFTQLSAEFVSVGTNQMGIVFGRNSFLPENTLRGADWGPVSPYLKSKHRFDLKRRSNRTHASIRGPYGNRGCAAREICDDEKTASR